LAVVHFVEDGVACWVRKEYFSFGVEWLLNIMLGSVYSMWG